MFLKGFERGAGNKDPRLDNLFTAKHENRLSLEHLSHQGHTRRDDGLAVGVDLLCDVLGKGIVMEYSLVFALLIHHREDVHVLEVHGL